MPSVLNVDTLTDAAGTGPVTLTKQSAAKVWINFNGMGTISTRDSFNVTSISDNGTSDYTVTINNNMNNANYSFTQGSHNSTAERQAGLKGTNVSYATGSKRTEYGVSVTTGLGSVNDDLDYVNEAIFGDLA